MICFHHNDLDGRCAAAIVKKANPEDGYPNNFVEAQYGMDSANFIGMIHSDETVVIVDFSFPPEVMQSMRQKAKTLIWIDHHKTVMGEEYAAFASLPGIRDVGFSGCELTWTYFFPQEQMPWCVRYIGDRDTWKWTYGQATAQFCEGIRLYATVPSSYIWSALLRTQREEQTAVSGNLYRLIKSDGQKCIQYRKNICDFYRESFGFEVRFEGKKCLAMGLSMFGSEAFGDAFEKYQICISFENTAPDRYTVSLFSADPNLDVSEIAKRYGGGGHKSAAGFTAAKLPWQ